MEAGEIIERLKLEPHPEGGWYREAYRSASPVGLHDDRTGERVALTAIFFLLEAGDFSAFHTVRSEEAWVHLDGAPLELVMLPREPEIGLLTAVGGGGEPLLVVPPDTLQAARTLGEYTLVSCLVAPGFDFADFRIPSRAELQAQFPEYSELIDRFTRQ
ncbi:MAG: cupin domain-containing protein [Geobacter sp.]|nr:cupin domain-containing protein [Geobacter sp.]